MSAGTRRYPPPATQFKLVRSRVFGLFLFLLQSAALGNLAAWMFWGLELSGDRISAATSGAFLIWLAATAACTWFWLRQPIGSLAWTGNDWQFHPLPDGSGSLKDPSPLGDTVATSFDLQACMLICISDARRTTWFLVCRAHDPSQWLALRCAVYSPASPASATPEKLSQASHRA